MTEIAVRSTTDLSIEVDQDFWTEKQKAVLVQLGVKDAGNADLAVFFHHAKRTGLDPFAKQIYMIGRWSREGTKWTIQTGIDGYRLIARRAVRRAGETLSYEKPQWCGEDEVWRKAWISKTPPAAATFTVLRNGEPFTAVAVYSEFVQTNKDGTPNAMWSRMPSNQLAKCAEALALRMAFPQDLAGIYTDEEMGQADNPTVVAAPARRVTAAEITGRAPEPTPQPVPSHEELPVEDEPTLDGWPATAPIPGGAE